MTLGTKTVTLDDLCELIGQHVAPSDNQSESLYLGLEHLAPGRLRAIEKGKAEDVQSNKFSFRKGDVLYGKLRPYLDKAVLADSAGICTTELLVLRTKKSVSPEFLACIIHAPSFIEHAMTGVTGAHHPRTSWQHISKFELPNFTEQDQQSIACLLWRIYDLIFVCEETQKVAESMKRNFMRELFSRGLRGEAQKETEAGLVPESWKIERLDKHADVISTRMAYTELESVSGAGDELVKVLGIKVSDMNRSGNEIEINHAAAEKEVGKSVAEYRCAPPGTIVFPKRGAAIATNKKRITTTWTVFDPNVIGVLAKSTINTRYLFHWFQSFDLRTITEPGPTPQINKKHLDPLSIPVPGTVLEQSEIVAVLDAIDGKIDLHKRKRAVLEELFKSLLHKLMTGEISVSDLDLSALQPACDA